MSPQSCPTLCDPVDGSPPPSLGFSRQERWSELPKHTEILTWPPSALQTTRFLFSVAVGMPVILILLHSSVWTDNSWWTFSSHAGVCSVVSDFSQPHGLQPTRLLCLWNFPSKKYWRGLAFPAPEDLSDPGTKPTSLVSPARAGRFFRTSTTREAHNRVPRGKSLFSLSNIEYH